MTDCYAVFGNPIAHSKSPDIHAAFAKATDQSIKYDKQCVEVDRFVETASEFFRAGGKGLNVTVPFKQQAYEFADRLTPRANLAGAVNTLAIENDGQILGDNTDGCGLVMDITERLGWTLSKKKVLILGAGGAVRGVLLPLLEQNPASLTIANRTESKAEALVDLFADYGTLTSCAFEQVMGPYDIIINGTSAGLSGEVPPISASAISVDTCVYDMVYGTEPTAFMNWAALRGAHAVSDGLGMLVGQAAESFALWRGVKPESQGVIDLLRKA